jgi:hypothetical protein
MNIKTGSNSFFDLSYTNYRRFFIKNLQRNSIFCETVSLSGLKMLPQDWVGRSMGSVPIPPLTQLPPAQKN